MAKAKTKTKAKKTARPAPRKRVSAADTRIIIGLMSGTSADGVDAAVMKVTGNGLGLRSELIGYHGRPYKPTLRGRVLRTMAPAEVDVEKLSHLNFELAEFFARVAIEAMEQCRLKPSDVTAIGSHGQTVAHLPPGQGGRPGNRGSTLQLADPGVIAARTGVLTIGNFRSADVALGGQGAPLVPITDWLMFRHPRTSRVVLNIGGIANLTWLPAGGGVDEIMAFDTGPGNCLLDTCANLLSNGKLECDENGRMAAEGQVLADFLVEWLDHPFFRRTPPKSTGREEFGRRQVKQWLARVRDGGGDGEDMMATLTELTATSISQAIRNYLPGQPQEVIVYGGGTANPTLMAALVQMVGQDVRTIESAMGGGMSAKAKEAASFALLAALRLDKVPGNVPQVTGAARPLVLGGIYEP